MFPDGAELSFVIPEIADAIIRNPQLGKRWMPGQARHDEVGPPESTARETMDAGSSPA